VDDKRDKTMPNIGEPNRVLNDNDIQHFIENGFVKIENAFDRALAEEGCAILWRDTGCDPDDPATWTEPVVRLGIYGGEPFNKAANSSRLHAALDDIVGRGRWAPRPNLGTFPIRFPSDKDPEDAGWHIDVSFGDDPTDFMSWRANIHSKGRALLMLFLFSDVSEDDAPTRIRAGSHLDIARRLQPAGDAGLTLRELARNDFAESEGRPEILATGDAGTVYLCHPFLVHAAQPHRGKRPRFMAQPALLPVEQLNLERKNGDLSPVEVAVRPALS
jgi:hypothetical protein